MNSFNEGDLEEIHEQQSRDRSPVSVAVDILETLLLSIVLFLIINAVSARIKIDGSSMEPTLHHGEFVIVSKLNYRFGEPQRGDIVVFDFPRNITQEYIKRVIGLPGDRVRIDDQQLYVNGQRVNEPYVNTPAHYEGEWQVPDDALFVLGDNRNNSSDSHNWGVVPMSNVIGEALFVYWPPESWGLIKTTNPVSASN